jgi:hypothetical protein
MDEMRYTDDGPGTGRKLQPAALLPATGNDCARARAWVGHLRVWRICTGAQAQGIARDQGTFRHLASPIH